MLLEHFLVGSDAKCPVNDSTMMDSEPSQWDPAGQNNGPTLEQPPDSQAAALPEQGDGQGNEDEMDDDDMSINPNAGTHTSSVLRHPPLPSAEESAGQPMLIRSSQLPPVSKRPKGLTSAKVVVQFEGDLDDMARGWSQEEWTARRRLVQFIRVQDKNVIKASFAPVRQVDFKTTDIVISCIFRDDKNECFVTSVDAIYLLEGIVGIRFSVEEKNRIRRNLEGFKPITVSKSKADSEAYFKLIMGFPNPKPRNIEKDVKVFPWKIIANAVKKIVGKVSGPLSACCPSVDLSFSIRRHFRTLQRHPQLCHLRPIYRSQKGEEELLPKQARAQKLQAYPFLPLRKHRWNPIRRRLLHLRCQMIPLISVIHHLLHNSNLTSLHCCIRILLPRTCTKKVTQVTLDSPISILCLAYLVSAQTLAIQCPRLWISTLSISSAHLF